MSSSEFVIAVKSLNIEEQTNMYSLLLGEGLLNDAIAIQLYTTISNYEHKYFDEMEWVSIFVILKDFMKNIASSICIGILFGFSISYLTKRMRFIA